jgi:hypothetical protein
MFFQKRLRPLRCPLFYFQGVHPVVFKWLAVSGGNFRGGLGGAGCERGAHMPDAGFRLPAAFLVNPRAYLAGDYPTGMQEAARLTFSLAMRERGAQSPSNY